MTDHPGMSVSCSGIHNVVEEEVSYATGQLLGYEP